MSAGQFLVFIAVLLTLLIGGVLWLARSGGDDCRRGLGGTATTEKETWKR